MLNCQHPPLGIKGILVIVLLCYSFAMSAAPMSSTTWNSSRATSGGQTKTTFRSTSTGMYHADPSTYRRYQSSYNNSHSNYNSGYKSSSYNTGGYQMTTSSSAKMRSWGGYSNATSGYSNIDYRRFSNYNYERINVFTNRRRSVDILAAQPSNYMRSNMASNTIVLTKRNTYQPGLSEERDDTDGNGIDEYFDEDLADWYDLPTGSHGLDAGTMVGQVGVGDDGKNYIWSGDAWVREPKNPAPIGATPYLLMALMIAAYIFYRKKKSSIN